MKTLRVATVLVSVALSALACAVLAGCPWRGRPDPQVQAHTPPSLAWAVNRAQVTHRLQTSSMEAREASAGNQFVVLDVSVRNRAAQPQVMSEGALIAMDATKLQTFDRPVTVFDDAYLSLQVLAPAQSARGKIAYEVPEHLPGVLFWSPGNGSERILLNLAATPVPQRTFADAADADAHAAPTVGIDVVPTPVQPVAKAVEARASRARQSTARAEHAPVATLTAMQPSTARPAKADVAATAHEPVRAHAAQPQTQVVLPAVATVTPAPPTRIVLPATTQAAPPRADAEQARRLACQGLVARDDPAEKERSLGFFAESCRDFTLPERWRPRPARRSLIERASDLLARVVVKPRVVRISDCSSASTSHADRLVCGDPRLSAMDHQLAQSVARASDQVDDPAALQRDQAQWRGRVRNACDTAGCLEEAYGRRIAQLDAIAPMQP